MAGAFACDFEGSRCPDDIHMMGPYSSIIGPWTLFMTCQRFTQDFLSGQ